MGARSRASSIYLQDVETPMEGLRHRTKRGVDDDAAQNPAPVPQPALEPEPEPEPELDDAGVVAAGAAAPAQLPEHAAGDAEDGWLCEAITALAGMLLTTWAVAYLWWHFAELLDAELAEDPKRILGKDEPWYFAWVRIGSVCIFAIPPQQFLCAARVIVSPEREGWRG